MSLDMCSILSDIQQSITRTSVVDNTKETIALALHMVTQNRKMCVYWFDTAIIILIIYNDLLITGYYEYRSTTAVHL